MQKILLAAALALALPASAAEQIVVVRSIDAKGTGSSIGIVKLSDTDHGLALDPDIGSLTPGLHGFHVHEHPSCLPGDKDGQPVAGLAAGGHYDPHKSGKHTGPEGMGHHGDLPPLHVNAQGAAVKPMLAPRLKLSDIRGRALMIHEGGDNFSDDPKPLGGGGARVACGVID